MVKEQSSKKKGQPTEKIDGDELRKGQQEEANGTHRSSLKHRRIRIKNTCARIETSREIRGKTCGQQPILNPPSECKDPEGPKQKEAKQQEYLTDE
ncbi:hypothetical protein C922_05670 [Plasmodium inui San Antonio 1]|uniref:Uncharacterized protein n=1 Tax=Plasmodium inui San Antonio 1 TaxID=1237626 RepID=W6ZXG2_9APIC|nr:hypothetical protein C922_05670 [Plasmodium inui San Antonio 1]EUD63950.1 hypothetical protein C922_05670 [Plasmodium inui San Antonio 1]